MNAAINDGGPVFPCRVPTGATHNVEDPEPTTMHFGMTLRDYFAAKAMAAMTDSSWPDSDDRKIIAKRSYLMADEMLKARGQS